MEYMQFLQGAVAMRAARFLVDILLFYAAYAWPLVIAIYVVVHFRYPHLVHITKTLDEWEVKGNIMVY
jgi:hypothetical protein